jgi:hypothetical protein
VRVMAYNSAGPGPESERFLERTFKLRPQKPPTAVQVIQTSLLLVLLVRSLMPLHKELLQKGEALCS